MSISKELALSTLDVTDIELDQLVKNNKIAKINDKFGLISVMGYKRSKKREERASKKGSKKPRAKKVIVVETPKIIKTSIERYRDYLIKRGVICLANPNN